MKTILMLVILGTISVGTVQEASAQVVVEVAPPDAYIASASPEYYEGRPVYYYNNYWYYRDHGRWSYYRHEPQYLYGRRSAWVARPGYRHGDWNGRYHYRR
jgi:hypothetical protein